MKSTHARETIRPWRLPWQDPHRVPHALLDIVRGCNIRCRACYNNRSPLLKGIDEVERDIDVLLTHRKLQSVAIVGGEVTLHPQLCEIVQRVRARGLRVELFTNGLLLDDALLSRLKSVGTDLVFLHIEAGQERPDLPLNATAEQLRSLQSTIAKRVADHGIDVGLAVTVYEKHVDSICDTVEFVLDSPHFTYLLGTLHRDHSNICTIEGDLGSGFRGTLLNPDNHSHLGRIDNSDIARRIQERLRLTPFACLGSNRDPADFRWLSYLVAVSLPDRRPIWQCLRASLCERSAVWLSGLLRNRYPMYVPQNSLLFGMQVFLNALTGGHPAGLAFLLNSSRALGTLRAKRVLFQCPATVAPSGQVIHCFNCPDAVALDGRLVPVCLADLIRSSPLTAESGAVSGGSP